VWPRTSGSDQLDLSRDADVRMAVAAEMSEVAPARAELDAAEGVCADVDVRQDPTIVLMRPAALVSSRPSRVALIASLLS
jgi:hypothetical protein